MWPLFWDTVYIHYTGTEDAGPSANRRLLCHNHQTTQFAEHQFTAEIIVLNNTAQNVTHGFVGLTSIPLVL